MTTAATRTLTIDPSHSTVGFSVRHLMITKVRGAFTGVSGTIELAAGSSIPVAISAEVDVHTIDTREPNRDAHLKSPDFFEADTYPKMTFASTAISPSGGTEFTLVGDLTIHGVTKSVTFEGEFTGQGTNPFAPGDRFAYEAKTKIKRSDFGLTWNVALEAGGVTVSDDVEITLDIQALGS
jgi:polyisoprenoid-binding protein YceI